MQIQVLQNADELFNYAEFSAQPSKGNATRFSTTLFVFQPNQATFDGIMDMGSYLKSGKRITTYFKKLAFSSVSVERVTKEIIFYVKLYVRSVHLFLHYFTGKEEDVLNNYFNTWKDSVDKHIPQCYNMEAEDMNMTKK